MRTADRLSELFALVVIGGGLAYFTLHMLGWLPMV